MLSSSSAASPDHNASVPLTKENIVEAINILAKSFELGPVVKALQASLASPNPQYYIDYRNNEPVRVHSRFDTVALPLLKATPLLTEMQQTELELTRTRLQIEESRKVFLEMLRSQGILATAGDIANYLKDNDRIVDLTDTIANKEVTPAIIQLNDLNKICFPWALEAEVILQDTEDGGFVYDERGLCRYVQAGKDPTTLRKIIGVRDEDGKIVGAVVFGVTALPEATRNAAGIDGAIMVTYLMVDKEERYKGLGKSLVTIAEKEAVQFLREKHGIENSRVALMTEQNCAYLMELEAAFNDWRTCGIGPLDRLLVWDRLGQRQVKGLDYYQASIREEDGQPLSPPQLGLYVRQPLDEKGRERTTISSDVLSAMIYAHTKDCLIKDQWDIESDPTWSYLKEQLAAQKEFKLESSIGIDARADQRELWAAMSQAAAGNIPGISSATLAQTPINTILQAYRTVINESSPEETPINFRPLDRYMAVSETHYHP